MAAFRVPQRFMTATLNSLNPAQFSKLLGYAKRLNHHIVRGDGLVLLGKPGVGKTWAIVALTRHYFESRPGSDYEFVTAPDMFDNLGDFGEKVDEYRDQLWSKSYAKIPWLVINDLGKEYKGGKLASQIPTQLGRVLRARSESKLVTHVTTNLTSADIEAAYGSTVASLLAEMTDGIIVTGKDRRKS